MIIREAFSKLGGFSSFSPISLHDLLMMGLGLKFCDFFCLKASHCVHLGVVLCLDFGVFFFFSCLLAGCFFFLFF